MLRLSSLLLAVAAIANAAQPADWIVSARYVVTVDSAYRVIRDGAVAVRGDSIVGVGTRAEIDHAFNAKQRLDRANALIMPGLINTHTHAAMSLLRGIADDRKLQDWLEKVIFPAEAKNVSPEFVEWGTKLACLEMMLSGTTTFTDMYYFEDVVARATRQAGMRGVLGETIIRFPVADNASPTAALAYTEKFLKQYANDPLIVPAIAPHAVYTNSDETLKAVRQLADRYHAPVLIHVSETAKENDDLRAQRKLSPTALLDQLHFFTGTVVAAHCVWLSDADMNTLAQHKVGVAHCPSSNMKLASGAAAVVQMQAKHINVGLGTDGPAGSNNDFDMMEEMDLAGKLQKLITKDPTALPARKLIEMATIDGARVLGMDKLIGSLEPTKRADMITISLTAPNAVPVYDISSQVDYALKGSDVRDVMVNGKFIVRDRVAVNINRVEVIAHAEALAAKVKQSLGMK